MPDDNNDNNTLTSESSQEKPVQKIARGFYPFGYPGDHAECLRFVEKSKKLPKVQYVVHAIKQLGCDIDLDNMIECKPCNMAATGGFEGNDGHLKEGEYKPKILICEDNLLGSHYVGQTLTHELIHAYDQCRAKVNWKSCYHVACTEIRASSLSGECDFREEFDRGYFGWQAQHQECVRRRAELSLQLTDHCKDKAKEVVDKVFHRCYTDTAPYENIP